MTLVLRIEGTDGLDDGMSAELLLDRHGAIIGRSPHADWYLPDPRNAISSRHCEISFEDGAYVLTDHSTNGTYLNGSTTRLNGAHKLMDGDRLTIGHYAVRANLTDVGEIAPPADAPAAAGWDSFGPAPSASPDEGAGWAPPPDDLRQQRGWRTDQPAGASIPHSGAWDLPAPIVRPSAWSSDAPRPTAPTAEDVWGRLSQQSAEAWSKPGDDAPAPSPVWPADPRTRVPSTPLEEAASATPAGPVTASEPLPQQAERIDDGHQTGWHDFVSNSGLPVERLKRSPAGALAAAGTMLRDLVGGLMLMLEARSRAKSQLGVQATGLELDGNNPLKFIRSPERAMLQLLDEPESGFMEPGRAVADAFQDLQAHQLATVAATRSALQESLRRFSPAAVRERAPEPRGLEKLLPALHRARLWDVFSRDFEGVVLDGDEAFMDVFGREFRRHYDREIAELRSNQ